MFRTISDIIYSFRIQNCSLLYRPINQLSQSDGAEIWLDSKKATNFGVNTQHLVSSCPDLWRPKTLNKAAKDSGQAETRGSS